MCVLTCFFRLFRLWTQHLIMPLPLPCKYTQLVVGMTDKPPTSYIAYGYGLECKSTCQFNINVTFSSRNFSCHISIHIDIHLLYCYILKCRGQLSESNHRQAITNSNTVCGTCMWLDEILTTCFISLKTLISTSLFFLSAVTGPFFAIILCIIPCGKKWK